MTPKLVAVTLIFLLTSCASGFITTDDTVSHRIHDLAGNGYDRPLQVADPRSFKKLNINYGKDSQRVYFQASLVESARSSTFMTLSHYYGKDDSHVYWHDRLIEGADPSTFRLIDGGKNNFARDLHDYYYADSALGVVKVENFQQVDAHWARDGLHYYYISQFKKKGRLESDYGTTAILNSNYAKDKGQAYFRLQAIPGSDARSFAALNDFYARDDFHVYYTGKVIAGADPASFSVSPLGFDAKDKNSTYSFGNITGQ